MTAVALDRAEDLAARAGDDDADGGLRRAVAYARLRQLEAEAADPVACEVAARALFTDAVAAGDLVSAGFAGVARQAARLRRGDLAWDADRDETRAVAERSGHREVESYLDCLEVARSLATAPLREADALSAATARRAEGRGVGAAAAVRMLQYFVVQLNARHWHRSSRCSQPVRCPPTASDCKASWPRSGWKRATRTARRALVHTFVHDELADLPRDWAHETALALATDAAFSLGAPEGAGAMAARLAPSAGQLVVFTSTIATFGRVDRYLGQLAFLQDDLDDAIEHFAAARALDHASGCRLWAGWAACDEAAARRRRGNRGDARRVDDLLAMATTAARGAGSRRLLHAVRLRAQP